MNQDRDDVIKTKGIYLSEGTKTMDFSHELWYCLLSYVMATKSM